jgi:hypothetical protein
MAKLIEIDYDAASPVQKLAALWGAFCDADPTHPNFIDDMEQAGLAELVPVDDEALEDSFAAERGIHRGGLMWQLTDAGRDSLRETST